MQKQYVRVASLIRTTIDTQSFMGWPFLPHLSELPCIIFNSVEPGRSLVLVLARMTKRQENKRDYKKYSKKKSTNIKTSKTSSFISESWNSFMIGFNIRRRRGCKMKQLRVCINCIKLTVQRTSASMRFSMLSAWFYNYVVRGAQWVPPKNWESTFQYSFFRLKLSKFLKW